MRSTSFLWPTGPNTAPVVHVRVVDSSGDVLVTHPFFSRRTIFVPRTELVDPKAVRSGSILLVVTSRQQDGSTYGSARSPAVVSGLLAAFVPEVLSGDVRIVQAARIPGLRTKVLVAATREGVDPVRATIGTAGHRVRLLNRMLQGERIEVVRYHRDIQRLVAAAMAPATPTAVQIHDDVFLVQVPAPQMRAAIGVRGSNLKLASELCGGRKIKVVSGG